MPSEPKLPISFSGHSFRVDRETLNKLGNWQAAVIICVIGFIVFASGLGNQFVGDDLSQVVDSIPVHSISSIPLLFEGGTFYNGAGVAPLTGIYYRPLMTTTYDLIYGMFGPNPAAFHVVQLLLYLGCAFLVFLFFKYSFAPGLALVLAIIFLVHPINSQGVYSIAALQEPLFFIFGMLALWIILRLNSRNSLFFAGLCLFLALLSKESGVLFIAISLLLLWQFDRERRLIKPFAVIVSVVFLAYMALRVNGVGILRTQNNAPIDNLDFVHRLLSVPKILFFYFSSLVFPLNLAHAYYWAVRGFSFHEVVLPAVFDLLAISLVAGSVILAKRRMQRNKYQTYVFFVVWFFVGIAFHLPLLRLDLTVSDTWMLFPLVGLLGMIGLWVAAYPRLLHSKVLLSLAAIVIILFSVRTAIRGFDWKDGVTLAKRDLIISKEDYHSLIDLSKNSIDKGDYPTAETYAKQSIAIYPTAYGYNELGLSYVRQRKFDQAKHAFQEGLHFGTTHDLYANLAILDSTYGPADESEAFIQKATDHFPNDSKIWMSLAIRQYSMGKKDQAKADIQKAEQLGPTNLINFLYIKIVNNEPLNISQ